MLIVENFFLIACDPRAGLPAWPRRTQGAGPIAAAALLLDLTLQQRLHLRQALLIADVQVPLTHPLLAEALHTLATHPLPTQAALELVARRMHPLPEHVLDGLFRRDLVHRSETRSWLLRRRVRYPLRSVQARNEAIMCMRKAAHEDDDLNGLALLLLADITGLLPQHLDAREHEHASLRLLALNHAIEPADEALAIFASVRTALLA